MQYWRSLTRFFEHPNWGTNLLFGGACLIIPYAGMMAYMGYMLGVIVRQPTLGDRPHERFDFKFFGEYLALGWRPFVVTLVVSLVITPISIVLALLFIGAGVLMEESMTMGAAAMVLLTIAYLVSVSAAVLVSIPMMLRAALTQDLQAGLRVGLAFDMIKRTAGPLIGAVEFIAVVGFVLSLVGMCLCYVGIFPASALVIYTQWQLMGQLLRRYIERGGEPIAVAPAVFATHE